MSSETVATKIGLTVDGVNLKDLLEKGLVDKVLTATQQGALLAVLDVQALALYDEDTRLWNENKKKDSFSVIEKAVFEEENKKRGEKLNAINQLRKMLLAERGGQEPQPAPLVIQPVEKVTQAVA